MIIEATKGFYKDKVSIKWNVVNGAEKYVIFRKNLSAGAIYKIGETTDIFFDDLNVIQKTAYVYFVCYVIGEYTSDINESDIGYAGQIDEEKENNFFIQEFLNQDIDIIFCFNNEIFENDLITIKAINCSTNQELYIDNIYTKIEKNFVIWNTINMPVKPKNSKILIIAVIDNTNRKSSVLLDIKQDENNNKNAFVNLDFGKLTF